MVEAEGLQSPGVRDWLLSTTLLVCTCVLAGVRMWVLSTPVSCSLRRFSTGCGRGLLPVLWVLTKESLATSTMLGAWFTCILFLGVLGAGAASANAATTDTNSSSIAGMGVQKRQLSLSPVACSPVMSRGLTLGTRLVVWLTNT